MGRYFNPPTKESIVSEGGRRLTGETHAELQKQLKRGEALGMHLDRMIFKQMPDVTRESEFAEFQQQVDSGRVLLLGFYAVPKDKFAD